MNALYMQEAQIDPHELPRLQGLTRICRLLRRPLSVSVFVTVAAFGRSMNADFRHKLYAHWQGRCRPIGDVSRPDARLSADPDAACLECVKP